MYGPVAALLDRLDPTPNGRSFVHPRSPTTSSTLNQPMLTGTGSPSFCGAWSRPSWAGSSACSIGSRPPRTGATSSASSSPVRFMQQLCVEWGLAARLQECHPDDTAMAPDDYRRLTPPSIQSPRHQTHSGGGQHVHRVARHHDALPPRLGHRRAWCVHARATPLSLRAGRHAASQRPQTIHPTTLYQTRFQTKQLTEYFSGSNAIGPYLIARFLADAPMGYGPFLMITLIYWMTGASGIERVA